MSKTLIFDFDGTLHNHLPLYARSFREEQDSLRREGFDSREYTDTEISHWLGMTAEEMWNDFLPELPEARKAEGAKNISRRLSRGILNGESVLYEGAEQVLDSLKSKGYTLVLLSNCSQKHMDANIAAFSLERWFSLCLSSGAHPGESKAQILARYIGGFESPCCVIGDRDSDFEAAKENGLKFIACRYGFGSETEFVGADAVIDDISGLEDALYGISC